MAYCIIGVNFENKDKVKELGAKFDAKSKTWYFYEPKNKTQKAELETKIAKCEAIGFKVMRDNFMQRRVAFMYGTNNYDNRVY